MNKTDNTIAIFAIIAFATAIILTVFLSGYVGQEQERNDTYPMPEYIAGNRFELIDDFSDEFGTTSYIYLDRSTDIVYITAGRGFSRTGNRNEAMGLGLSPMADSQSAVGYMTEKRYWETKATLDKTS